jgi:hypothetical protein
LLARNAWELHAVDLEDDSLGAGLVVIQSSEGPKVPRHSHSGNVADWFT